MSARFCAIVIATALLMSACGGGGGESATPASPTPTTPSPAPSTSVTADIPPGGATLQIAQKDVLTVAAGTFTTTARTSAAWVATGDSQALTSQDLAVTLPLDKVQAASASMVTLYFYPEAKKSAQAAGVAKPRALTEGLDPKSLFAVIASTVSNETKLLLNVTWDAQRAAYVAALEAKDLAALTLASAVQAAADWRVRVYARAVDLNASRETTLYRWLPTGLIAAEGSADPAPLVPLVLVHGIKGFGVSVSALGSSVCGANNQYAEAWQAFANHFFADKDLPSRYALYSFQYPTNVSIGENGGALAAKLSHHFGKRAVVVVSHSMGGLVTRAADLADKARPATEGIRGVITLDTPHLGTPWVNDAAAVMQMACLGAASDQGAKDLAWALSASADTCGNSFLCGASGLNNDLTHLGKYILYAGSFELPSLAQFGTVSQSMPDFFSSAEWRTVYAEHSAYAIPWAVQMLGQIHKAAFAGVTSASAGDGMVLVSSQLLQTWDGKRWNDQPPERFKAPPRRYVDTDHSSIHDDLRVFNLKPDGTPGGIRADLLDFYAEVTAPVPVGVSIVAQPASTTVAAGQSASFSVSALGTGPLSYQWRRNGANVSCSAGSNCPTFTTPPATTGNNGDSYSVVVSNSRGSATSAVATLTVTPPLVAPVPIGPTGSIVSLTPTFSWTGGSGAANYEINIRDQGTGQIVLRQQGLDVARSSFTPAAGVLSNGRNYSWNISACPNAVCAVGYVVSATLNFTTPAAPPPSTYSLAITMLGNGVIGYGGGLSCSSSCTPTFNAGGVAVLTPTAAAGYSFSGWSGACSGTGNCILTMDAAKAVTAIFSATTTPQFLLTMSTTGGAGSGTIAYAYGPSSGTCPAGKTCQANLTSGTVVSLAATASAGSSFGGWSGACTGTGGCSITMGAAKSVTAAFVPIAVPRPVVTSINPSTMVLGGTTQSLAFLGTSFTEGNVAQWAYSTGPNAGVWSDPAAVTLGVGQVTMPITADSTPGTYLVRICRSATATASADCSSNTPTLTLVAAPDLALGDFGYTFGFNTSTGRWTYFAINGFQISNLGTGYAVATKARFEFRNTGGTLVLTADLDVPPLVAGASFVPGPLSLDLASLPAGVYTLTVIADATAASGETNTGNNRVKKTFTLL